jgi:hypothetical protein
VSKTSRFSDEYKESTARIEQNSIKNLIRKWGHRKSKYNVGLRIPQSPQFNPEIIPFMEPLFNKLQVPLTEQQLHAYVSSEQPKTKFNLIGKFILDTDVILDNDVVVVLPYEDAIKHPQRFRDILLTLSDYLCEGMEQGEYELLEGTGARLIVQSPSLRARDTDFVNLSSPYYQDMLL